METNKNKIPVIAGQAVVEVRPQKLRKIRPCSLTVLRLPASLSDNTRTIMSTLFGIFEDKKRVEEGLIGDIIFGFMQAGIPPGETLTALGEMEKFGYVKFQAPDNSFVPLQSSHIGASWLRYQNKLLDMIYEE